MKCRSMWLLVIVAMLLASLLAACGPATTVTEPASSAPATSAPADPTASSASEASAVEPTAAPAESSAAEATAVPSVEKQLKFTYVSPNPLGVNTSLILGKEGTEQAAAKYNAESKILEAEDPTSRKEDVLAAAREGADIVLVLGFEFADIIADAANQFPDTKFVIIDQCIENPPANVYCAMYREHEASFLFGAASALMTKSNHLGAIGAMDFPFMHRFTDAFADGAKYVNPDVLVDTLWIGGDNPFADPARGKEQALALYAKGADIIFPAAGASDYGIWEAAKEKGFLSIGADDGCAAYEGALLDAFLKRIDVAVIETVDAIMAGSAEQVITYGVKEGGVGMVALLWENAADSKCTIMEHPDVIEQVKAIQDKIISGEIVVNDPMAAK